MKQCFEKCWKNVFRCWEEFFYSSMDDSGIGIFRIGYAVLCFLNITFLGFDLDLFYTEHGWMPLESSQRIVDPDTFTVFSWLPTTDRVVLGCYGCLLTQIVLLGLGLWPRVQAAGVFFWLTMFQHRNIIVLDGEDFVFRLLAFLLIFAPLHRHSIVEYVKKRRGHKIEMTTSPIWPLRLIQIEMCLIFISAAMLKWREPEWRDGTALYYVIHLDDLYGKYFNPPVLYNYLVSLKMMTWLTLMVESLAPITIWFSRSRMPTLIVLVVFHVAIDLSMNLNLFHWIMILGWLSFLIRPVAVSGGYGCGE